jgi:mycofactocin precursor
VDGAVLVVEEALVVEEEVENVAEETPVTEELLVEEISIDGMCGVY